MSALQDEQKGCHMSNSLHGRDGIVKKFIEHVDNTLQLFIEPQPLPVFVFGTTPSVEYFKKITRYRSLVSGFFAGNYQDITEPGIISALQPYFKSWEKIREASLLNFFEKSYAEGRAYAGIKNVYHKSLQRTHWLLLVEKSYKSNLLNLPGESNGDAIDDVDTVIEKVLWHGGEVEFVANGALTAFSHIGLAHK
jgi:hypothetical protein